MDLDELRSKIIGYSPVSDNFKHAGDRRRFIYYAKQLKLNWEFSRLDSNYDIVYITTMANITDWINYKRLHPETVLIFDINNSYFFQKNLLWNFSRGLSRFITKRESKLYFNYNNVYHKMFKCADVIVCPTSIAKDYISQFNPRVHISFDYFMDDITMRKSTYRKNHPLILVWEGMGFCAKQILSIAPVLKKYRGKILLKIISDRTYKLGGFYSVNVPQIFERSKFDYEFIAWEKDTFSKHITEGDLAIIPLDKSDKLVLNKPENKLILFWQHGLPVLTTDIPTYKRAFAEVDSDLTCKSLTEWEEKLDLFLSGKFRYEQHMDAVNTYLNKYRSRESFIKAWDKIFNDALNVCRTIH